MTKKLDYGIFCDIFGKTIRNLVLENCLVSSHSDFSVGSLAEELEISRPMVYKYIYD